MHMQRTTCSTFTRPPKQITLLGPAQGQVLNQTSAWWMEATQHIVPNALLAVPDPNVSIMRKCSVFPVEFVVRGFMTGAPCTCPTHLLTGWPAGSLLERQCARDVSKASSHNTIADSMRCWCVSQAAQTRHCGRTTLLASGSTAATPFLMACARMTALRATSSRPRLRQPRMTCQSAQRRLSSRA
jgi:SAICAR synthetase